MYITPRATSVNVTKNALEVFCAYPISGPYTRMIRPIIYILLFAAFFSSSALKTSMVYTAVSAIHLCAMAAYRHEGVLDLDMLPAYNACLLGLLFAPSLIMMSSTLKEKNRTRLSYFLVWMVLLWTGIVS